VSILKEDVISDENRALDKIMGGITGNAYLSSYI